MVATIESIIPNSREWGEEKEPRQTLVAKISSIYEKARGFLRERDEEAATALANTVYAIQKRDRESRNRGVSLPQVEDMDLEFRERVAGFYGIQLQEVTERHVGNLKTNIAKKMTGIWPEGETTGELTATNKAVLVIGAVTALGGTVIPLAIPLTPEGGKTTSNQEGTNLFQSTGIKIVEHTRGIPFPSFPPPEEGVEKLDVTIANTEECSIEVLDPYGNVVSRYVTDGPTLSIKDIPAQNLLFSDCAPDGAWPVHPQFAYEYIDMVALLAAMSGLSATNETNVFDIPEAQHGNRTRITVIDTGFALGHKTFSGAPLSQSDLQYGALSTHGDAVASVVAGKVTGVLSGDNIRLATVSLPDVHSAYQNEDWTQLAEEFATGLEEAVVEQKANVVVMSLGISRWTREGAQRIDEVLSKLSSYGYYFVLASGNDANMQPEVTDYWAKMAMKYPNIILVGATDELGDLAWFSNKGEIYAPGVAIPTANRVSRSNMGGKITVPESAIRETPTESPNPDSTYTLVDGTSFAAPHVGGIIGALGMHFPEIFDPENYLEFHHILTQTKIPGSENVDALRVWQLCWQRWGSRGR